MADEWELANLEKQVSDLEYEKEEYRLQLIQARELLIEASHYVEDRPAFDRRLEEFLRRLPR